ncbi:hypothetical protein [Aquabacterium humicola]|uniref:hypothetical protein n=1 Tax=Aquabacterium humicola TaxID=3237377 RepID=UPI0025434C92|nr:hypothetical protein [Rubrivivax pictus]
MVELFREGAPVGERWTVCRWHECPPQAFTLQALPFDTSSAIQWLHGCRPSDLQRMAVDLLDPQLLTRATTAQLVEQLAAMMVGGQLRVIRGRLGDIARAADDGLAPTPAQKLMRRLRVTSHLFHFEAERLRIVDAREWSRLHGSTDSERYRVLPRAEAAALMARIAAWPMLSHDEATAVGEGIGLLPAHWRPERSEDGLLLVRIVDRTFNSAVSQAAEAVTPSQMSQATEEEHWIQIALLDDQDQPVPNQAYKIELPDGAIREGRLDADGKAYVGGLKTGGACKVCFPQIDAKEWRAV